ncbi:MAG: Gfo/Idh/MocA family oxidoreductase, partial [Saprospiraceae bacterium]
GHIPADSWVHDMRSGGGRIVGEACHLIDLISYFTRSPVQAVVMNAMGPQTPENTDNASLLLRYENGSQGVINYFSNGSKGYAKERIEIYSLGRTAVIDNFRRTTGYDFKRINGGSRQDKGHFEQFRRFHLALTEGSSPIIPYEELINTSKVALAAITSLQRGEWIEI